MAVGGLVAVGVADADVVAVFALAARLLDDAGAAGHDRRALGARPVDAGVHSRNLQDRMAAHAEARGDAHVLAAHRAPHQELARRVALLVVVVDRPVGRAEAIELAGFAARGDGGGEQLAEAALGALLLFLQVEEELERVAGAHALAEVRLVGMDLEDLQDDVGRDALPRRGIVDAGVEAGSLRCRRR